jgi:uncharacterized OsmC-like protein
MPKTTATTVNGVKVDELFKVIEAVKATPGIAKFKFHLNNKWLDGAKNRSTLTNFYAGGQEVKHEQPFTLDADEPPMLQGNGSAPNPVEYLLEAITACVTTALVYHAAAQGIAIEEIESHVEGDIDLRGFLGLDKNIRRGFQNIRMDFKIKADVSDEQLEELGKLGPTFSPVFDSVTNGVPVTVKTQRKQPAKAA